MPMTIEELTAGTGDWRASIKKNNRRTLFVITFFILIYLALGLVIDVSMYANTYRANTLGEILIALITFKIFPMATLICVAVAGICILVTLSFHDQLMLLGTEYTEVTPTSASPLETQLYHVIEEMKIAAGLNFMPKVYLIEADYMNAFASGFSEKSAMVAITRGLATKLNRSELQAVMAHELSHIRHMDIKLTLMASVLSNLILIIIDILFYSAIFSNRDSDNNRSRGNLIGVIIIARYLLPIINVLLLLYLSRTREYMADAGAIQLLRDNQPLASALLKIENDHHENSDVYKASYANTPHENVRREAYIFDPVSAGFESVSSLADVFSTHPNIKDRLAAIGFKNKENL